MSRSRRLALLGIAALVVVAVAVILVLLVSGSDDATVGAGLVASPAAPTPLSVRPG